MQKTTCVLSQARRLFESFAAHPLPRGFGCGYWPPAIGPIPETVPVHIDELLACSWDRCFTTDELRELSEHGRTTPNILVRLLTHLPQDCAHCWKALRRLHPHTWTPKLPLDPLARVLRAFTTGDHRQLTPTQQLMIQAIHKPVAFGRLLLEEGEILAQSHCEEALPLMRWSTAMVDFLADGVPTPDQEDLYALRHLYLVEAHLATGRSGLADQELDHAKHFLDLGSNGAELRATWHEKAAKVLWHHQGCLAAASRSYIRAIDQIRDAEFEGAEELWGRRLELLVAQGILHYRQGQYTEGQEILERALRLADAYDPDEYPLVRLELLDNLAFLHVERRLSIEKSEMF